MYFYLGKVVGFEPDFDLDGIRSSEEKKERKTYQLLEILHAGICFLCARLEKKLP